MKTKTEYLFGHPPSRYAKHQVPLALMKIEDAQNLLNELRPGLNFMDNSNAQLAHYNRIEQVKAAKEHWQNILNEALEEEGL